MNYNGVQAPAPSLVDLILAGQGVMSQTISRTDQNSATALVSGTAYFMGIPLRAGMLVSNVSICVTTAGAAVTLSKVGLHSKAGTQLAVSADQGTNWHSTGVKTIAMGTAYVVPTSDMYYASVIAVFTSTAPALMRGAASGAVNINLGVGSGSLVYGVQLAQADMPSPATIVQGATTAINYWAAVS